MQGDKILPCYFRVKVLRLAKNQLTMFFKDTYTITCHFFIQTLKLHSTGNVSFESLKVTNMKETRKNWITFCTVFNGRPDTNIFVKQMLRRASKPL